MAIGQCKECSQNVSTAALTCPSCGCPHPHPQRVSKMKNKRARKLVIYAVIIFVVVCGVIVSGVQDQNERERKFEMQQRDPVNTDRVGENRN
jgi:hypothetical protein